VALFKTFWVFRKDWLDASDGLPTALFYDDCRKNHPNWVTLFLLPGYIF
jgi:hypothetical protein